MVADGGGVEMTVPAIRILLVDDAPDFLASLNASLSAEPNWQIVAHASDGWEAVDQARQFQPDVILMDIAMPKLNGIDATRHILKALPQTKVIMLTASDREESLLAAARAGARGYIVKGEDKAEIMRVVQAAQRGDWLWGSGIADKLHKLLMQLPLPTDKLPSSGLTPREIEVLKLIAQGLNNDEIAVHLFISRSTVKNHITRIFSELQVRDRAQAILWARDTGL